MSVRGGATLELIERPRVLEQMQGRRITLLEAPSGYGKSTVCAQFAAMSGTPAVRLAIDDGAKTARLLAALAVRLRRGGLGHVAEVVNPGDGESTLDHLIERLRAVGSDLLIVVDDVHRAAPDASAWLAALLDDLPPSVHLIVAGRRLGPALAAFTQDVRVAVLGPGELRFDDSEIAAVITRAGAVSTQGDRVAQITSLTDGWPAAVVLAAAQVDLADSTPIATVPPGPGLLRGLVEELLDAADARTRRLAASVAGLPLLSAEVLAAADGDGALDRLLDVGLPIRFRADGWGEMASVVREALSGRVLPLDRLRAVAGIYASRDALAEALLLLQRAGDPSGVVDLLARQPPAELARAGLVLMEAILGEVDDDHLAKRPRLLVNLIRVAEHRPRLRGAWAERAARVVEDPIERRALDAELAMDAARAGRLEAAQELAEQVIAAARNNEAVTRGRAHQARAMSFLLRDLGDTAAAAESLEQAAVLFRVGGEAAWEAYAHQALGYGIHFTAGAFALAAERLERAIALEPTAGAKRADTLTYVAEVFSHMGRLDEAEAASREASLIGHRLGDSRVIAYAAWSAAEVACQRRDARAAAAALAEAEAHPAGWFELLAAVDFLSQAAEIRTVIGDEDGALRDLLRAEERAAGTGREAVPMAARARFETTFGDARKGLELLDIIDASPLSYPRDRWLRLLLRGVCLARLDDGEAAAQTLQQSRQAAAEIGDPDRAARREPELVAMVSPQDVPAGATAMVRVLGRFAVERGGIDITPAPGRPTLLVKLLAVRGVVTPDEAIDILWPNIDLTTGRARLRNVLSRVRATSGMLVERSDGGLALAAGVEVDARRFERAAASVLASPPERRADRARRALQLAAGELLPGDRYADWSIAPRDRLRRRHLAMLDIVADDAVARGELDEACSVLDTAIGVDPLEEQRYVRLAQALLAQGRPRRAGRVVEQAVAVTTNLGVSPGDELSELRAELVDPG